MEALKIQVFCDDTPLRLVNIYNESRDCSQVYMADQSWRCRHYGPRNVLNYSTVDVSLVPPSRAAFRLSDLAFGILVITGTQETQLCYVNCYEIKFRNRILLV